MLSHHNFIIPFLACWRNKNRFVTVSSDTFPSNSQNIDQMGRILSFLISQRARNLASNPDSPFDYRSKFKGYPLCQVKREGAFIAFTLVIYDVWNVNMLLGMAAAQHKRRVRRKGKGIDVEREGRKEQSSSYNRQNKKSFF